MTTSPTARWLAAALLAVVLTGCAGDGPVTPPDGDDAEAAAEFDVVMQDGLDFEPEVLTVPAGSVVEVVNQSSRAHSMTSTDGAPVAFDTGPVPEGDTAELRLDEPGRYPYECRFHPGVMDGVLVVE